MATPTAIPKGEDFAPATPFEWAVKLSALMIVGPAAASFVPRLISATDSENE